jgi:hypothetical protein
MQPKPDKASNAWSGQSKDGGIASLPRSPVRRVTITAFSAQLDQPSVEVTDLDGGTKHRGMLDSDWRWSNNHPRSRNKQPSGLGSLEAAMVGEGLEPYAFRDRWLHFRAVLSKIAWSIHHKIRVYLGMPRASCADYLTLK